MIFPEPAVTSDATSSRPALLGRATEADWPEVAALLARCGLPREGAREHLADFVILRDGGHLAACGAVERYADAVLLRSVAVDATRRAQGCGRAVTQALLRRAIEDGVQAAYLRTTDAADYWALSGFRAIEVEHVPERVRASVEFQGACPAGATTMRLDLAPGLLVRPALRSDMPAVLEIYNHEVRHSTSTYQYAERTLEEQVAQWELKRSDGHGFFVAETLDGRIAGYASYGVFRPREGWRFTCEHSVYLHPDWRGRGVGKLLMAPVMAHARRRGFHVMVGVVDAANEASVKLHRALGFDVAGVVKEGGYKFDRWLDVAFLQARL